FLSLVGSVCTRPTMDGLRLWLWRCPGNEPGFHRSHCKFCTKNPLMAPEEIERGIPPGPVGAQFVIDRATGRPFGLLGEGLIGGLPSRGRLFHLADHGPTGVRRFPEQRII